MSRQITVPKDLRLDTPLWRFAGNFWARPAAQSAALALQARGWSVTDLLCALWLSLQGRRFEVAEIGQVVAWRGQVTETLRALRKAISKGNPATDKARDCIARSELEAEKVELALAYKALNGDHPEPFVPYQHTAETLTLDNLHVAAPENAMDNETSELLDTLIRELQIVAQGAHPSC